MPTGSLASGRSGVPSIGARAEPVSAVIVGARSMFARSGPARPLRKARASDDQGDPFGLLVGVVLELDPMGASIEPVVRGEDEERLSLVAVFADQADDPLDLVVDGEQALLTAAIAPVDVSELGIG